MYEWNPDVMRAEAAYRRERNTTDRHLAATGLSQRLRLRRRPARTKLS
jgi:hypothetical protein